MVSDEVTGKIYFSGKNFVYMVYTNKVNFRISGTNFVQLFYTKFVILLLKMQSELDKIIMIIMMIVITIIHA